MPRINRRVRIRPQTALSRAQVQELLLGPDGASVFGSESERNEAWVLIQAKYSDSFAARWFVAQQDPQDFARIAAEYARQVERGETLACEWVKLACRRHLEDLERASDPAFPYRFDPAKAARPCRFIELLPHIKGNWAARGEYIRLESWQVFIVCSIFGWVKKATGTRRFSLAYIEVCRKNAKSTLAAGIGNYMLAADGEFGAEVYSGATNEAQAHEVFRPARQMMERSGELALALGVTPAIKRLAVTEDGSRFEPVIGKPGDGASPHCGIVDEYHEHDSDSLFDTLRTGMGARMQPLLLVITTAGDNNAGPCKLLQGDVAQVLKGSLDRPEMFGIIYSIDPGDDWSSEEALIKANPNIGVSVFREFLLIEQRAALMNARKQGVFQTKHLDVWVGAMMSYFNLEAWKSLGDPELKLEQFIGLACVCAIDLSTKRDFTARVIAFKKVLSGRSHYYIFVRFYLPEDEIQKPEHQHYQGWAQQGYIIGHPGATVDFERIENETIADIRLARARELAFDPWNAEQLAQAIARETKAAPVEIRQNVQLLSPPMKELDAAIADGRVHHENNPVLNWMIGNVSGKEDANENVFPRKESGREENKIDGAIAVLMATSRLMLAPAKRSVYASRGLLTVPAEALNA